MQVEKITAGPLRTNCYVLKSDRDAVVIDLAASPARVMRAARDNRLRAVLLTHGHNDHLGGAVGLGRGGEVPVFVHENDWALVRRHLGDTVLTPLPVAGELILGDVRLTVIHTPGHTPGSCCFYAADEGVLFSGDTLFKGGIGRTDLPGGSERDILRSIRERLITLPPTTVVYPGHGGHTTIADERRFNPFLQLSVFD